MPLSKSDIEALREHFIVLPRRHVHIALAATLVVLAAMGITSYTNFSATVAAIAGEAARSAATTAAADAARKIASEASRDTVHMIFSEAQKSAVIVATQAATQQASLAVEDALTKAIPAAVSKYIAARGDKSIVNTLEQTAMRVEEAAMRVLLAETKLAESRLASLESQVAAVAKSGSGILARGTARAGFLGQSRDTIAVKHVVPDGGSVFLQPRIASRAPRQDTNTFMVASWERTGDGFSIILQNLSGNNWGDDGIVTWFDVDWLIVSPLD